MTTPNWGKDSCFGCILSREEIRKRFSARPPYPHGSLNPSFPSITHPVWRFFSPPYYFCSNRSNCWLKEVHLTFSCCFPPSWPLISCICFHFADYVEEKIPIFKSDIILHWHVVHHGVKNSTDVRASQSEWRMCQESAVWQFWYNKPLWNHLPLIQVIWKTCHLDKFRCKKKRRGTRAHYRVLMELKETTETCDGLWGT